MAEYIEREAFIKHLQKDPLYKLVEQYGITHVIESFPAADVAPVRHGRWNVYSVKDCLYTCSECHCLPRDKTPYCPNCGAKMGADNDAGL